MSSPHGLEQVAGLEGDGLEPGGNDVGGGRGAREAENRGAGLCVPMRRSEPLEGRHERDAGFRVGLAPSASLSAAATIRPSVSRSHCTVAPAMKIAPSSA